MDDRGERISLVGKDDDLARKVGACAHQERHELEPFDRPEGHPDDHQRRRRRLGEVEADLGRLFELELDARTPEQPELG
jgi:hypothetical protein